MHFNFIVYFYLQYLHRHVSVSNPANFKMMFYYKKNNWSLNVSQSHVNTESVQFMLKLFFWILM